MQGDTILVYSKTSFHIIHRLEHVRLTGKSIGVIASTIDVQLNPVLLGLASFHLQRLAIHPMNEVDLIHLIRAAVQDDM